MSHWLQRTGINVPSLLHAQTRSGPCRLSWGGGKGGKGCLGLQGQGTRAQQNAGALRGNTSAVSPGMESPPLSLCPSQNAPQTEADT